MKKIFFTLLYLLTLNVALKAQPSWTQLSFTPSQGLCSLHCVNYDTVVAVGDSGYIIRTTNSGANWTSAISNTTNVLYKVTFVNDTIGYAVGAKGTILITTDAGQNWSNIGINTNLTLLSVSFINKDTGWVAGGNVADIGYALYGDTGILMKTTNGGTTWIVDSTYDNAIASVFFIDNNTGYICANYTNGIKYFSLLNKTTNSGNSFSPIKEDSVNIGGYFTDIYFISPETGYYTYQGHDSNYGVYKTSDYGNTWTNILSMTAVRNLFAIDSCSFYYSVSDMPGSFLGGNDICLGSGLPGINNVWVAASFIHKNMGFAGTFGNPGNVNVYKLDTVLTGVTEAEASTMELFPNPFKNTTTISFNQNINISDLSISVYNSLGKKIIIPPLIKNNQLIIDLSNYSSGIYYLLIRDLNKVIQGNKLIKD